MKEYMYLSKLINLIYLIITISAIIVSWNLGYDRGIADTAKPSETASDILTINTRSLYMTVDGTKSFRIETKEVIKDDE